MRGCVGMQPRLRLLKQPIEIGRDEALPAIGTTGEVEKRAMVFEVGSPNRCQNSQYFFFDLRHGERAFQLRENSIKRNGLP